jgi:hypothetical protein
MAPRGSLLWRPMSFARGGRQLCLMSWNRHVTGAGWRASSRADARLLGGSLGRGQGMSSVQKRTHSRSWAMPASSVSHGPRGPVPGVLAAAAFVGGELALVCLQLGGGKRGRVGSEVELEEREVTHLNAGVLDHGRAPLFERVAAAQHGLSYRHDRQEPPHVCEHPGIQRHTCAFTILNFEVDDIDEASTRSPPVARTSSATLGRIAAH